MAAAGVGGSLLAACGGGDDDEGTTTTRSGASTTRGPVATRTVKVGVVGYFSGIGSFIGDIANRSLDAAVKQINEKDAIPGIRVELVKRDTGDDATNGPKHYQELVADKDVAGILWAQGAGFNQTMDLQARDGIPVMGVFNDLETIGELYPEGRIRSFFQFINPTRKAFDFMCRYAKRDRGYSSCALLFDTLVDDDRSDEAAYKKAAAKYDLENKGVETFTLFDTDFKPQLQRLQQAKPEVLFVFGLSASTALIVKQLAELGASYVDTPTAKSGDGWHPHVMGAPGATGEKSWAIQAGDPAKIGTVTAWVVGGLIYLPSFVIRQFLAEAGQPEPTGGEEAPANALYALLKGVEKAGSIERKEVVEAIETLDDLQFASVKFGFTPERHLALTDGDVTLVTLERGGKTPYQLGKEFGGAFPADYVGPTQLVDFTLEANRKKHPEVMKEVLDGTYGSSVRYQPDDTSRQAFTRVH